MDLWLLAPFFYFLLPPGLLLIITLGYIIKKGLFYTIGLTDRDIALLTIGPVAAMLFEIPLFMYHDYFLALNIGGAVIPLAVAIYFISKKHLSAPLVLFGVALISIITFLVTDVKDIGVVSSFPYYLLPPVIATITALLMYPRPSDKTPGYAYTIATLGVIIGADIYHLPEIVSEPFSGSLGGAGLYDMVFITGLLSLCLSLPVMRHTTTRPVTIPPPHRIQIRDTLKKAQRALHYNQYTLSLQNSLRALHMELGTITQRFTLTPDSSQIFLQFLGKTPQDDYNLLRRHAQKHLVTKEDAEKGLTTTLVLLHHLSQKNRMLQASLITRIIAFLIDFLIICSLAVIIYLLVPLSFSPEFTLFVLIFSLQFIYFTVLEHLFSATPGKYFVNIQLMSEDGGKPPLMSTFTRNIIRFLELILGFYLISAIMIAVTAQRQRLGDKIAHTLVVKNY